MCSLLEMRRTCRRKGISIFKPVFIPKLIDNFVQPLFLQKKKHMSRYWIIDELYLKKTFQCSLVNKILKLIFYKICICYDKGTSGYFLITFCVFDIFLHHWSKYQQFKKVFQNISVFKLFQEDLNGGSLITLNTNFLAL